MSVFEQPVAHPPYVEDERPFAASGELAAKAGRVRVERPRLAERAEAPDLAQELLFREDAARIGGELQEQLVLLRGQVDPPAADRDAAGRPVDLDRADADEVGDGRRRPPQDRPDAREQLVVEERPAEEVVGAALERPSAVDRIRLGSAEDDERHLAAPRAALLERRGVAEEDQIRPGPLRELERLAARGGAEHVEAVVGEVALEEASRRGLRLGDEDCIRHTRDATDAPPPQLDVLCRDSATNDEQLPRPDRAGPCRPWRPAAREATAVPSGTRSRAARPR